MKLWKESTAGLVICLLELITGILLLLDPIRFTSTVIIGSGIVLIVLGLMKVGTYFRTDPASAALGQLLTKGLISILAGVFCVIRWKWFLAAFSVLTVVFGSIILLTGIRKIQLSVDMARLKNGRWRWAAANSVLTLVCAMVVLCNPFASTEVLWCFTGAVLVGVGIFDLVIVFLHRKGNLEGTYEG